ncbi:dihydrofolate reductase family protein [Solirhodobacter olei]|uniref:dihydrofolate reductase family protein n=1 Tax=Solirhodobacter olei TaxID=2493082 RepID=UPI000FD903D4
MVRTSRRSDALRPRPFAQPRKAEGKDVRIGGGASVVTGFLKAGLIDCLHVAIAPIFLGCGFRPLEGLRGLGSGYASKSEIAESGTVHLAFRRWRLVQSRRHVIGAI